MSEKKDPSQVIEQFQNRRARREQQDKQRRMITLGAIAAIVLVVLIVVLCVSCDGCNKDDKTTKTTDLSQIPVENVQNDPMLPTDEAGLEEDKTQSDPAPEVTPAPLPPAEPDPMLQVFGKGSVTDKRIAITVNVYKAGEVDNFNTIMTLAESNEAALTVFPMGQIIEDSEDMETAVRRAFNADFEIENLTYSCSNLFSMEDDQMAAEIWKQSNAVNHVIGGNYEMHFLRTYKGYSEDDPWVHRYLIQLGTYKGFAHWTVNAAEMKKLENVKKGLKPGAIYMFGTSENDVKFLKEFIPYAIEQGYELVTLNELLGFEKNGVDALDSAMEMPLPEPYTYVNYITLDGENYRRLHAAKLVQERLIELGYLTGPADGNYGNGSREAIRKFQAAAGLTEDGIAGKGTQTILFSVDAPAAPAQPAE